MAHSYTNLKYHVIFSTKYRLPWITAALDKDAEPEEEDDRGNPVAGDDTD